MYRCTNFLTNIRKLPHVFFFHFMFRHRINVFTNVMPSELYLLGYDTVLSGKSKVLLDASFILVSCMTNSSDLKMEVTCSSEILINFHNGLHGIIYQKTRLLHNHCNENFKSNMPLLSQQCLNSQSIKLYDHINNFSFR